MVPYATWTMKIGNVSKGQEILDDFPCCLQFLQKSNEILSQSSIVYKVVESKNLKRFYKFVFLCIF